MRLFLSDLFRNFGRNLKTILSGWNLFWFGAAAALTYIIVVPGGDWWWFVHTRLPNLYVTSFPAIALGSLVPLIVPIGILLAGRRLLAFTLGQAAIMSWGISSILKAFTGRIPPHLALTTGPDISHGFQFGFLRGGIFWGWPSSHATVAFAMAFALVALYPKNKIIRILAPFYALYVGLGVSISIHWFSEFIAGAIIGTVIGLVVGRSYRSGLA